MFDTELPRPGLNRIINDLGVSIVNRTDRLASDISHNNAQIEKLEKAHSRVLLLAFGLIFLSPFIMAVVIMMKNLW
jgi:DNA invertase Pin-like site-specific DNA recombinase